MGIEESTGKTMGKPMGKQKVFTACRVASSHLRYIIAGGNMYQMFITLFKSIVSIFINIHQHV